MATTAKRRPEATNGPTKQVNPNLSPKAQAAEATKVNKVRAGVAHHATENAPHTKRAIQQNREAEKLGAVQARVETARAAVKAASDVAARAKRNDPKRQEKFVAKTTAELELKAALKALAALDPTPREPKTPAAPKAPRSPRVVANRTIKAGPNKYANEKGGWTLYMVTLTLKHKDTDSATAAHKAGAAKAGQRADKPLDFKWMNAKGYIVLG